MESSHRWLSLLEELRLTSCQFISQMFSLNAPLIIEWKTLEHSANEILPPSLIDGWSQNGMRNKAKPNMIVVNAVKCV